ncbi:AF4/FMR2 family member lilli [Drosophila mojavensis]|uniref:AF4/FMR2 family member lilli n=1 Tax=Drosophila mojavensis TaxID=7230 RepID=UPI00017C9A4A|nr:AF4/FMR2 family member lilli [Drosophila mojavensis]
MSLSVASRRRYQTTTSTAGTTSTAALPVRKQHSLIETPSHAHALAHGHSHANVGRYSAQQRGYLSRGLSVGRSIESIRQKLYAPSRQASLAIDDSTAVRIAGRLTPTQAELGTHLRDKSDLMVWASTSSMQKTQQKQALPQQQQQQQEETETAKADKNRINLNIVLAQTIRATNEQEAIHSDIDSATECSELPKQQATAVTGAGAAAGAAAGATAATGATTTEQSVSSALTVQRRPPLVRAMSAPVRLDENSKSVLAASSKRSQQQKLRRRKVFSRATSSVAVAVPPDSSSSLLSSNAGGSTKKSLSRARSVIAPDVITLVSLLSSEGSDSEREENSSAVTPTGGEKLSTSTSQRSPQRRAPLLRKTGKSVSFQDSYPPTFQLASKEYSHMIRRGSIAPLAARIRANRPPTAPPVSIFLSEAGNKPGAPMESRQQELLADSAGSSAEEAKKENNAANCNVQQQQQQQEQEEQQQQDYNFPLYVCSIKERECWKLHQKMCAKGVSVSYDTVLRGMLTPTEFRHFQKQREHEEAKAQEAADAEAEAAAAAEKDHKKTSTTAIERLSESLLQRD